MFWSPGNKRQRGRRENVRFRNRGGDSLLVVDVPPSRRELRQRRKERTVSMVRWMVFLVLLGLAAVYTRSLWLRTFRGNAEFAVGHFEFHSNGGIPAHQAQSAAGLRGDMNVMDVDLTEVRSRLLALPRVKAVSVERRLPDKFSITLEERLPVAWVTSMAHGIDQKARLFVDRDGVAFKCDELLREYMTLPVINAADQPVITVGREINSIPVRAALALLQEMRSRDWTVPCSVSRIDIPNSWTVVAEMESGAIFTFSPDRLDRQLDRLEFIFAKTRSAGRSVASVNLQMERNVPVRFFDQPAPAAPRIPAATEAPLMVDAENVAYTPGTRQRTAAPAAPRKTPARSREQRDIETILRGH